VRVCRGRSLSRSLYALVISSRQLKMFFGSFYISCLLPALLSMHPLLFPEMMPAFGAPPLRIVTGDAAAAEPEFARIVICGQFRTRQAVDDRDRIGRTAFGTLRVNFK